LEARRRRLVWEDKTAVNTSTERLEIIQNQYQTLYDLFEATGSVSRDELSALLLERIQAKGQLDNSLVQKALAELEYRLADQQLMERSLIAPIDGLVTKIEKFNGEWVSAGDTVAAMVDLSSVILRTSVPDQLARLLKQDSEVTANIDGVGEVAGVVRFISPVADPASGLVRIRITIPNPDGVIRPGTRGRVLL
jgi:multidrug efflux pump subunit AcrA (membrane-fusion protein)